MADSKGRKLRYRNCPKCGEGMYTADTRFHPNKEEIWRRYRCVNDTCKHVFSTVEILLEDPRRTSMGLDVERLMKRHDATMELLQELGKGRTQLYAIEAALLKAFNEGTPNELTEPLQKVPFGEPVRREPLTTPSRVLGGGAGDRKARRR